MRTKGLYSDLLLFVFFVVILAGYAVCQELIYVGYAVLCIWALLGAKQAIQALSLNYIFLLLNPALYSPPPEALGILRWVILLVATLRIIPLLSMRMLRCLLPLSLFFLMVTALAWMSSPSFELSFLKIAIFTLFAATVLIAFDSLDEERLMELKVWFFALMIVVVVLSLPTLFMPKVGFNLNGRGFQGIFIHPQAFGIFLVPPAAYQAASLLFKKECNCVGLWFSAAVTIILIFLSGARTGMLAFLFSLAATWVIAIVSSRKGNFELKPFRSFVKIGVVAAALVSLIAVSPAFSDTMAKFWIKGGVNSFYLTRGKGIVSQWNHFLQHPLTGNGFGIDVGHENFKNPSTFLSVPVSAAGEKGFLPVAFLEEVGIVGLLSFALFFLVMFRGVFNARDIGLIGVFFACLLVNIGEDVFFSPGYIGGYMWLLIGLSTAKGWQSRDGL